MSGPRYIRWHQPEFIPGLAEEDSDFGRGPFWIYVLETDWGHYVGHTHDVESRFRAHCEDSVLSTAGTNPSPPSRTAGAMDHFRVISKVVVVI